jgi:CxxC-x17-CxxC domain-containing protein
VGAETVGAEHGGMVSGLAHRPLSCDSLTLEPRGRWASGRSRIRRSLRGVNAGALFGRNSRAWGFEIRWGIGAFGKIRCVKPLDGAAILRDMSSGAISGTADDALRRASAAGPATPGRPTPSRAGTPQEDRETVYEDRTLTCRDCSEEFTFSSGEQAFFASKGLMNDPQRCPSCRAVAKRARTNGGPREFHAAICGSCGGQAMVPFAPRNDRPVYCSACFDKVRAGTITEHAIV